MAVSTTALATLAQAKLYLDITDEDSDALLEKMIDRASSQIERYCSRKFKSRSYDRVQIWGNGRDRLVLPQFPVSRVFRVTEGESNAFQVTNTTATTFATVEVSATQIRLNADGTVTNLTLSTYATINLLIAAINGTAGWSATLISGGTTKPTYTGSDGSTAVSNILPMPASDCKSTSVAYVSIPQSEVSGYCLVQGGLDEDRDAGMLYLSGGWSGGVRYMIDFVAGYTSIPSALEDACVMLVKYMYDKKSTSSAYKSEGLGDYNYTLKDISGALPDDILREVNLFRSYEF
jgi:hypothetical protein